MRFLVFSVGLHLRVSHYADFRAGASHRGEFGNAASATRGQHQRPRGACATRDTFRCLLRYRSEPQGAADGVHRQWRCQKFQPPIPHCCETLVPGCHAAATRSRHPSSTWRSDARGMNISWRTRLMFSSGTKVAQASLLQDLKWQALRTMNYANHEHYLPHLFCFQFHPQFHRRFFFFVNPQSKAACISSAPRPLVINKLTIVAH